jgi:hypothetical protein
VRSYGLMLVSALALITGCSMTHGDPENPKRNLHPVKRYEVTVTADAPGPWDSVKGRAAFEVINAECVPHSSFTGARPVPNTTYDFELARVGEKTWKGYFYRDQLLDENYFGQGLCHWDATTVGPIFAVKNETFNAGAWLDDALNKGPQTSYFKKSSYGDHLFAGMATPEYSALRPEFTQNPAAFFPVVVVIKEATP